jgi:hypothetical protein
MACSLVDVHAIPRACAQETTKYPHRYHDVSISTSGLWHILKHLGMNRLPASRRHKRDVVDITPCNVFATYGVRGMRPPRGPDDATHSRSECDGGHLDDTGGLFANYMTAEDFAG